MDSDGLDLPDRPGGTAPHVLVESVLEPELSADDLHHLVSVRRLRDGDFVSVTDGCGSWRWCALERNNLCVLGETHVIERPSPELSVGFALVKGSKPELVVQKLTEIGVDVILPFTAERSVVQWDESKIARQTERLRKVAHEASMQSRRVWLPQITSISTFSEVACANGAVRADRDGERLSERHALVLIGPEGGWSPSESNALPSVSLGQSVLRSETAAIAAATLMVGLREGRIR